ncbi:hypothetical protein HGM15179_005413 [Zosterops borbonicus]|uniref:Uncharacterized protein n=1 Tax=Zosterops borbonicus TaxID=364589 RepID=A0A8K1LQ46_9PASS|nr:hypothetical protein HGM15179_005413 [Zosterops borbonicus]
MVLSCQLGLEQEKNLRLQDLGVMEIVLRQESATLPCEGIFRSAFIWLLYLDASRIQVIPVSGLQVTHCTWLSVLVTATIPPSLKLMDPDSKGQETEFPLVPIAQKVAQGK